MQDLPKSKQITSIFSGMMVHRSIPLDRGSRERSEQLHLFPHVFDMCSYFTICYVCVYFKLYMLAGLLCFLSYSLLLC